MVYEMLKSVQAGGFGFGNVLAIVVHFKWDGDKLKKIVRLYHYQSSLLIQLDCR
jgi:hypothetical protein